MLAWAISASSSGECTIVVTRRQCITIPAKSWQNSLLDCCSVDIVDNKVIERFAMAACNGRTSKVLIIRKIRGGCHGNSLRKSPTLRDEQSQKKARSITSTVRPIDKRALQPFDRATHITSTQTIPRRDDLQCTAAFI